MAVGEYKVGMKNLEKIADEENLIGTAVLRQLKRSRSELEELEVENNQLPQRIEVV